IVELGLLQGVAVDGKTAVVALAVPLPGDESRAELTRRVIEAVGQVPGIERVDVDIRDMHDDEILALAALLKGVAPPNPLQVVDASQAGQRAATPRVNPFTDSRTRILAVSSGKGGVGKSSVTTNLSVALAERGHRVAAVDADVWGFSMPRMLGISAPPGLIDDVIIPPEANGVRLISMGFFAREDQAVIWRGPMLHKALEQFLTDVYWGELDFLVVDMPPGTGDISLSIAEFLPRAEVLVVTTPQPAAQRVAQRAAAMAEKVDLDVIGVIENMSWFTGDDGKRYELFGAGGGEELAGELGVPLLARIPLVEALREGGDVGRPIVVTDPDGEVAQVFRALAERLDTDLAPKRIYNPELKIN
ncbi:MAG: ATP-binding protein involved in chromosome partitioning, partial [Actinomycetota bacterium]|nr:ATP-binding protein involved in chromosome partitioning [Actinomycetota bacterium]